MGYYRRPYYLTMLGKPYLSTQPYSSLYKKQHAFEYPKYSSDWYLDSWPRPSDDYLYWLRPGATRYPRYFPVYEWCCSSCSNCSNCSNCSASPSHSHKYEYEVKPNVRHDPIYSYTYPDYYIPSRWYDPDFTTAKTTVIRSGPYGTSTYSY